MTYQQTLNYLFERLPMFQRIGAAAYKADLRNTLQLMEVLNQPHHQFKSIHVAGTNGKGSSSHMLASVLQAAGYKTGLYTSPHMVDFRERIKINGEMIPKKYVVDFVAKHQSAFEKIEPSFFEWTVGLAFNYFKDQKVDIAIIEVGLGGRLDSTNVITPEISLITNISFDHMNLLGNTLQAIAAEKAGIVKTNIPVVISQTQKEIKSVFIEKAKHGNASICFADQTYKLKTTYLKQRRRVVELTKAGKLVKYSLDLTGTYQITNLLGVLQTIELLNKKGFTVTAKQLKRGLGSVCVSTNFTGRWQTLSKKPLIIADTGHNEDGIKQVIKNIKQIPFKQLHMVIGMVNDKDVSTVLNLLPKKAKYYFVKASIPRALDAVELQQKASEFKLKGISYADVKSGVEAAVVNAGKNDLVFVGGSTFVVADALTQKQFSKN
ncbi:MAG: bifunctional folylpolyglutamate synthase/dihydrofolate synthase [Bacteroidetes bacterium]|nr:bifunctional folylpolyglutamate synthase/dihydrofolate synthase [Bacteroidota bacterium]MCA6445303.1 bifunctional folylpolyglutamate synthase/dihydrofolate synthase [Bacteroidota bacterium]